MDARPQTDFPEAMKGYLATEHFTLQGARSIVNSEIASRVQTYFTVLSGVIIAASFVTQMPQIDEAFVLFGALAFPLVILLGFLTAARLGMLGSMDAMYIKAINRIRHFYAQTTPEIEPYLLFPPYDDMHSMGAYGGWRPGSFRDDALSAASAVVAANSLMVTVLVARLVTSAYGLSYLGFLPYGVGVFLVSGALHGIIIGRLVGPQFQQALIEARFPAEEADNENG
jgi:hypothetical protein